MKSTWLVLSILLAALPAPAVTLTDFKLVGNLNGDSADFALTATANVENSAGGTLPLLAGEVGLTAFATQPKEHLRATGTQFFLDFDRKGKFPVNIKFTAKARQAEDSRRVEFTVAPSVLQPMILRGWAADAQFQFEGAARPERRGNDVVTFLPADGLVKFSWRESRPESAGKLFFSSEMLSEAIISPGLMRQVALLNFKVMQGELGKVSLRLRGAGEITRVQGDQVLAWNVEPIAHSIDRRLLIQLNQPQKDHFALQVQAQTPLGAFPQTADVLQFEPENAMRFAGYLRLVNEGAVRLEVTQAAGMSQISPDQFPQTDATRAAFRDKGTQRFAYRFTSADYALRAQADQILPELSVSELLGYHVAENELAIDAELELDVREAPLRELLIDVPRGFAVAQLSAAGLSDYYLTDATNSPMAQLRLVYGQPILDRQLVQFRLERNQALNASDWALPRIGVTQAKSVRGFVGVAADTGLRLTAEKTRALTEIATAFYPGKLDGLQAAFRVSEKAWEAELRVERLPQTVQAGVLHLFSIGEGVAYGSSVLNYVVSGAPVGTFKIDLSDEYDNVEFTGKEVRNWQKIKGGYTVQLQTPVTGAYTLLATYERPFKAQGETLAFMGARPLEVESESGYTLVTSAYPFDIKPVDVSPGLLSLEPAEVPPEDRLFFDAPILAAYRYAARPFHLKLSLSPLAQGDSLNQIVDRAVLHTRISKEGQVLTEVRYYVKSRGNPHFRLTIPAGSQLWSASANGRAVVPVQDGNASLIPLPPSSDPNAVVALDLKLASQSPDPKNIQVKAPVLEAPVMLSAWSVTPDTGQRLVYQSGTVRPVNGPPDNFGFIQLARLLGGEYLTRVLTWLLAALGLAAVAGAAWQRAKRDGVYRTGAVAVVILFSLMIICFVQLGGLAAGVTIARPEDLTFLAPVQPGGAALNVAVSNIGNRMTFHTVLSYGWPVPATVALWLTGRFWPRTAGWLVLAWGSLQIPNGAAVFFWVLCGFLALHILGPVSQELRRGVRNLNPVLPGVAPATSAIIAGGLWWFGFSATPARAAETSPRPDSVTQNVRVEDGFATGTAHIQWQAAKGETLALLSEPAVLTHTSFPTRSLELEAGTPASKFSQRLVARSSGLFDIEAQYQVAITTNQTETGFVSPVPFGLINRVNLTVVNLDVDVHSPQAVSIHSDHGGSNTTAALVLSPTEAHVSWQPRQRDVRQEKPVFYADVTQLAAPTAGVVEGAHSVFIRPAQGQVDELILDIPKGVTATDVTGAPVSLWRFDPDTGKLRVTLATAQSKPFSILIRSQIAAGPLPFEQNLGLITVEGAAGQQIGLTGVATGNETQLDTVVPHGLSAINLEDFPHETVAALQGLIPGLTLRQAFRYSDTSGRVTFRAITVEPDVRVETDDTLSLGEDRTVLADNFAVDITRAGIFELSFLLPPGFDLESVSGTALTQWTESRRDSGRCITLHLAGKTLGRQTFALSLSGPGVKAARGWPVPQVILREANKQQGTLLVAPEQGMQLQAATRDGYTQLDPQKSGILQKGVLEFRLLQVPAKLALDIEEVAPWIQVTSLEHASIGDTQVKVIANLHYQIENTGLKTFRVLVPAKAEGVRFEGDQLANFAPTATPPTNGCLSWEVKLRRRMMGSYLLQTSWQTMLPSDVQSYTLRSVVASDANLQRGFVTVQSDPRLQVITKGAPTALQPAEWQSIPGNLQKDLQGAPADFTYRLVEPDFALNLGLERHQATKLLPAHVNNITFRSVVADDGEMLTRTELEIVPGDKQLLDMTLPPGGRFWLAFVNHSPVWPWRAGGKILIPLDGPSDRQRPVTVEIFASGRAGEVPAGKLDLDLSAPKFDLPLENITWQLALGDRWQVKHWSGALQLAAKVTTACGTTIDEPSYLQEENTLQQARTTEAQEFLTEGNDSLDKGNPREARRAFEAAYGLSTQDAAFNEDARVQLHNIRLQQALIGFNASQSEAVGDAGTLGGKLRDLRNRGEMNYSQQDAKDIIDINTADENAAFMRLAEKLVQQQDAARSIPAGIRPSLPDEGQVLTFKRDVAVDPWADLNIHVQTSAIAAAPLSFRMEILVSALLLFAVLGHRPRQTSGH